MLVRFCLYSVLKNLRFAEAFMVLFLLHLKVSLTEIGLLLGGQHALTGLLEVPLGAAADRYGRRTSLALCFLCYALSFGLFATVARGDLARIVVALSLFGLGEALRTGSHKAIMLDYLDARGRGDQATRVVGITRAFSRMSAGAAALAGGLILYLSRDYAPLFALAAAAAALCFGLMLTYPRELEGEGRRDAARGVSDGVPLRVRTKALVATPGVVALAVQSVLFESQIKLALKYYLQPFLKQELAAVGLSVLGAGALVVGGTELLRDSLGAAGAAASPRIERAAGGTERALSRAYRAAIAAAALMALCAFGGLLVGGVAVAVGLSLLQNARRPVFINAFNRRMDKPQRTTTLSIESLARTACVALLLPLAGLLADRVGLWAVFALSAALLALGLAAPTPAAPGEATAPGHHGPAAAPDHQGKG